MYWSCPTDVMGDGVNIAARLQQAAEPGGIWFSQTVYDVVKNRLSLEATFIGPTELKHIKEKVPVYRLVTSGIGEDPPLAESPVTTQNTR